MKDVVKTFSVAFAYAAGIVAGMCAAPVLVEKVSGFAKKLMTKGEN